MLTQLHIHLQRLKLDPVMIHLGCQWGCSSTVEYLSNIPPAKEKKKEEGKEESKERGKEEAF